MPNPRKTPKLARKQKSGVRKELTLLDDPGGSPFEWLETGIPCLREAVRRGEGEPWDRLACGPENDALTERRRRKLERLSLMVEVERHDSAA